MDRFQSADKMEYDMGKVPDKEDYLLFYKIIEKKYVPSLTKDGQVYFGLLETYRQMEQHNMTAVGDRSEASLSAYIAQYIEIDGEYHEIHGPTAGNCARVSANQCAFCCYYVGMKQFEMVGTNKYRFEFDSSDISTICADKGGEENCAIIIFDDSIVRKICKELNNRQVRHDVGRIIYDDFKYVPKHDIHSLEYALECVFHKSKRYEYQNEFRIGAINQLKAPINDLFIPVDPSDFSVVELNKGQSLICYLEIETKELPEGILEVLFNISFENG